MPATSRSPRILIADDQQDVIEALRLLLKGEGFQTESATSPGELLRTAEKKEFDAVLMDMNYTRDTTSGWEGMDLLSRLETMDSSLPVIVMTAWGSVDGAVEAMRRGAMDYIEKPWDNARLLATLRTQIELGRALRRTQRLEDENRMLRTEGKAQVIAESAAMQPVLEMIERIGPSEASVLITGEHGTGKEIVARMLHATSERAARPLVAVNVGGLSETVFESELFGHVKGAFTDAKSDRVGRFELADGGTLFLDEVANVPPKQQGTLLRVMETGEVQRVGSSKTLHLDVRFLAATNADLQKEVAEGRFREDLLYRLNTVEIHLPPLRSRREDILPLATHVLSVQATRYRKNVSGFAADAVQALMAHRWPGNVRELEHAVERAVLLTPGDKVRSQDLGLVATSSDHANIEEMTLEEAERVLIEKALQRFDGNVSRASEALGVSRSALYRRLERHDL